MKIDRQLLLDAHQHGMAAILMLEKSEQLTVGELRRIRREFGIAEAKMLHLEQQLSGYPEPAVGG